MTNILDVWITCKFLHHTWFSKLNSTHKKSEKIRLCIDFKNVNCSQNKRNYPVPSSKPMLHAPETVVFSSLKGLLEFHQVPIAEPNGLTLVHEKLGPHTYHLKGGLTTFLSTAKISSITFNRSGRAYAMYIVCLLLVVFILFALLIIFVFTLCDSTYYFCSRSFFFLIYYYFVSRKKCCQLLCFGF